MRQALASLTFIVLAYSIHAAAAPESPAQHSYRYYLTGSAADVQRPTRGLFVLQGGGDDVDHNYVHMGQMGGGGDFVVLRASGDDEYNDYIYKLCHCNTNVRFTVDGRPCPMSPGRAYEINNQKVHSVMNRGKQARISFIFDYFPPPARSA